MWFEFWEFFLNSKAGKVLGIEPKCRTFNLMYGKEKYHFIKNRTHWWFTDLPLKTFMIETDNPADSNIFHVRNGCFYCRAVRNPTLLLFEKRLIKIKPVSPVYNSDKSFVLKWTWRTYLLPRHFISTCNVTYHHRNLHSAVKYVLLYEKKCLTFLRGSLSSRKIVLIEIFFFWQKTSDPVYLIIMMPI